MLKLPNRTKDKISVAQCNWSLLFMGWF